MTILPDRSRLVIEQVSIATEVTVTVRAASLLAPCPCCGTVSKRVQSHYPRTLRALPESRMPRSSDRAGASLLLPREHMQRHPRVFGIPNGLDWDAWNPSTDSDLVAQYTAAEASTAKARNRTSLRHEFELPDDPGLPVIGIVSRLVDQKGFDLIAAIASELSDLPLQLV
jgi:glycosyltransferase involved in cell wall biosynthesis